MSTVVGIAYVLLGILNFIFATQLKPVKKIRSLPMRKPDEHVEEEPPEDGAFVYEDVMNAFDSIRTFTKEFNKTTKINRYVLCAAALSFFLAAYISFTQVGL